ncbi:DNA-binding domain-containing protein [Aliiroseovarius sp. F47248L]|uniref:HvfC/BufC N-terminal domain-containing protein n=1 Tax=Aliiroseovarius sp. F47248L TaxID=2926420 RepID=UPI001FF19B83|nr:DNA-binding domain-containing protein [Aliiroseovarius sp. F47248L]MCK0139167.1 putative DNA-binding domain-containing protein [Aliiroseovarius sp. F47248L]
MNNSVTIPKTGDVTVTQTAFRHAVLDPRQDVPEGLTNPDGQQASKRFSVYRNNVAHSLSEAMLTGFPVLAKLVGDEFFREMAKVYLRIHPPASPLMMHYGAALPGFLESFPGTLHLKYLPDVARLELALRRAYHAADAQPIDPTALTQLDQPTLMNARLNMSPACEVLSTKWPAKAIWDFNMKDGPQPSGGAEDIVISRIGFDPVAERLPDGGAPFVRSLIKGRSFGTALGLATADTPDFNLTETLNVLITTHAITGIDKPD